MSDPVTNIEIEDVLSSIRKLVADGDKARTRDPAPSEGAQNDAGTSESSEAQPAPAARPEKLVLTPAFLVSDSTPSADQVDEEQSDTDLSDMIWEAVDEVARDEGDSPDADTVEAQEASPSDHDAEAHEADHVDDADQDSGHSNDAEDDPSDRSRLEASIAELEAAVSRDDNDFEPDGSEASAETFYWPGSMVRPLDEIEDAETDDETDGEADDQAVSAEDQSQSDGSGQDAEPVSERAAEGDTADGDWTEEDWGSTGPESGSEAEPETSEPAEAAADVYDDDDLNDLLADTAETIDEEALRKLVAEIVREELMGTLGERITRNVRKLVRREIYRILSSQEFD